MFHTIKIFLSDIERLFDKTPSDNKIIFLGSSIQPKVYSLIRMTVQMFLTIFILFLCTYIVLYQNTNEALVRLAHTGFGTLMGYWFR
jgi:hypothetical protein